MGADTDLLVERLARLLIISRRRVVTAESCTGGGIAWALTAVPGSSQWFDRGFVVYSNLAKEEMLSVPAETLSTFGAVSEQTAKSLAVGALIHSPADLSVAVTGIAGPDGGTQEKPVGTVCFGWSVRMRQTKTARIVFAGNREQIRHQSILMAIQGLIDIAESST